ncbi:hypothetical protein ACOMHN_065935 [Nucella lapillus]
MGNDFQVGLETQRTNGVQPALIELTWACSIHHHQTSGRVFEKIQNFTDGPRAVKGYKSEQCVYRRICPWSKLLKPVYRHFLNLLLPGLFL